MVASAGLSSAEIGGISGGVVAFVLILAIAGFLLFRHLSRISRVLDKMNRHGQQADTGVTATRESKEVSPVIQTVQENQRPQLDELSPQDRPRQLEDWGRHGTVRPELVGGYETHGVSELDGSSRIEH